MSFSLRLLVFFYLSFPVGLAAQCPSLVEIRSALGDSTLSAEAYAQAVHRDCPTAADSLSRVFYARSLYFNGLGEGKEAIRYGELAVAELLQIDTSLQLGKMNFNLGLFNYWEDDLRESLYYFQNATAIFARVDHPESNRRRIQSMEETGLVFDNLGDYQRAEEILLLGLKEAELGELPKNIAQIHLRLAEIYDKQGNLGAAAGAMEVAVAGADNQYQRATARVSRVSLNHERGRRAEAIADLEALLRQPDDLQVYDLARLHSLGILLALETEDTRAAEAFFEENLVVANNSGSKKLTAQAWDNGGEISLVTGNYPQARERFTRAVELVTPGFVATEETTVPTGDQITASPYKVDLLIYLGDLARALQEGGTPRDALTALLAADRVADQLRAGLGGEVSSLYWREEVLPIYEQAIALTHQLQEPAAAFYFFEKSRAVLLLESLAEADLLSGIPRSATLELLKAERAFRGVQQFLLDHPEKTDSLRKELYIAREALLAVRSRLGDVYPGLKLKGATAEIIGLETARENLFAGGFGRQLQYFTGVEKTYVMVVTPDDVQVFDLGATEEVLATVRPLLAYFTEAKAIDQDPDGYRRAASLAYSTLVAPAAAPENVPLLIVPDGLLSYVPFAALRVDDRYLVERNPVAYAQSSTLFGRSSEPVNGRALAFTPFTSEQSGQPVPALPFTAPEASSLGDCYPTNHLDDKDATREALLDSLPFGILHLGTHAQANRTAESAPRILTATEPLYLPDVYGFRLNGALVTLSACNSNVGPLARGEGVLGLGRAFRAAGAGGVVASLWSLNDRATADITGEFYEELAGGATKPLALHSAQLAYLNRDDLPDYLKSPYYWAGLTYYGDAGKVEPATFWVAWWAGAVTATLVLGGLFWYGRRSRPRISSGDARPRISSGDIGV